MLARRSTLHLSFHQSIVCNGRNSSRFILVIFSLHLNRVNTEQSTKRCACIVCVIERWRIITYSLLNFLGGISIFGRKNPPPPFTLPAPSSSFHFFSLVRPSRVPFFQYSFAGQFHFYHIWPNMEMNHTQTKCRNTKHNKHLTDWSLNLRS